MNIPVHRVMSSEYHKATDPDISINHRRAGWLLPAC